MDVEDDLLLVEVELGEPPQRVAAEGKAAPKRLTVHLELSKCLDPPVLGRDGAFLRAGVEVVGESDASRPGAGVDQQDVVNHADVDVRAG
jgi:hypothetical protein